MPEWEWDDNPGIGDPHVIEDEPMGDSPNMVANARGLPKGLTQHSTGAPGMETGISNIPRSRLLPWDKTTQVIMPYYNRGSISVSSGAAASSVAALQFRLNSIYDIQVNSPTYAADPVPAAQAADATINTPKFRAYWMEFYQYWTVIKSRYRIRFWDSSNSKDAEAEIYCYHHGQQVPPILDHSGARLERDYRQYHPNMHMAKIHTRQDGVDGGVGYRKSSFANQQKMTGVYSPGSIRHEVAEDELVEIWHRATEVPPLTENVLFIIQRSQRSADIGMNLGYEIEFEYTVQLKDLKARYEYVGQESSIPAIANFAKQGN